MGELRDCAAVKPGRGDDIPARPHQRKQREDLRGVTGRAADCARAALERGNPVLQGGYGRVGQPRIDVTHLFQIEEPGRMFGITKLIRSRLIDRHLPRAGCRIWPGAGMDHERIKRLVPGHGFLLIGSDTT